MIVLKSSIWLWPTLWPHQNHTWWAFNHEFAQRPSFDFRMVFGHHVWPHPSSSPWPLRRLLSDSSRVGSKWPRTKLLVLVKHFDREPPPDSEASSHAVPTGPWENHPLTALKMPTRSLLFDSQRPSGPRSTVVLPGFIFSGYIFLILAVRVWAHLSAAHLRQLSHRAWVYYFIIFNH